jgi:hypothetical protein
MSEMCSLLAELCQCSALSTRIAEGAKQLFDILGKSGGKFLWEYPPSKQVCSEDTRTGKKVYRFVSPKKASWQVNPEPDKEVDEDGNLLVGLTFSHELLARDLFEDKGLRGFSPTGQLSYLQDSRSILLSQMGRNEKPDNLDDIANGQLSLMKLLYPLLHPKYGLIDERGYNRILDKSIRRTELRYIFWANFFAPSYVEKYGRKLFLQAPGWKKELLDDGGILYVVSKGFVNWLRNKPRKVLDYFQATIPGIKLYHPVTQDPNEP